MKEKKMTQETEDLTKKTEKMTQEIGNRIRATREKKGKTQQFVADSLGISNKTLSKIENGETSLRVETLMNLCDLLEVLPDSILPGQEVSPKHKIEHAYFGMSEEKLDIVIEIIKLIKRISVTK